MRLGGSSAGGRKSVVPDMPSGYGGGARESAIIDFGDQNTEFQEEPQKKRKGKGRNCVIM
jgi:hypothetical protein